MYYHVIFLICVGALGSSVPQYTLYSLEDAEYLFEEFLTVYKRSYSTEEEKQRRFDIFKQTLLDINRKNSNPHETATFGITKFADLTKEEFSRFHTGYVPSESNNAASVEIKGPITASVPDKFDWREHDVVTPVKNQGWCGSCWAFSAIGAVESAYAIKHKKLISLSEEQLVECDTAEYACNGGSMKNALSYIIQAGGVETEEDYPYTSGDARVVGQCKFNKNKVVVKVANFTGIVVEDEEALRSILISSGPIAIGIAGGDVRHYTGGIMTHCRKQPVSHGVLLVGYGEENGIPYWIIKNSWGLDFGEAGYFRVKRGINACNLKYDMTSVVAA